MAETTLTEQTQAEQEERLKCWQVLWGVIRRPGKTFQQTGGRAGLGLPVLLMLSGTVFLTVATTLSQQEKIAAQMQKELAGTPGISPEQIESMVALSASPAAIVTGAVMALICVLLGWVIQSGILHLVVRALGGKGVFRQAFGIVCWAWIPLFLGGVLKGVYVLATGNLPIPQGTGLVNALLANTDLFAVWNMVILVLGFAAVYGVSKKRAAVPVVGIWALTVLFTYATGFFGEALGPGLMEGP